MSEKPSGIAHHAVIHHLHASFILSTAVDAIPHATVVITVQAITMITMAHLYSLSPAYIRHSLINC